jgi:hypothetical protein
MNDNDSSRYYSLPFGGALKTHRVDDKMDFIFSCLLSREFDFDAQSLSLGIGSVKVLM